MRLFISILEAAVVPTKRTHESSIAVPIYRMGPIDSIAVLSSVAQV